MTDHPDTQLRELTIRLMNMAPDAPPFPEIPMTTLKPSKSTSSDRLPPRRRNRTALAFAAGAFGLALLVALPLILLRGDDTEPATPTSTAAPTTAPPTTTGAPVELMSRQVTVYYLADYVADSSVAGPHLVPLQRIVEVPVGSSSSHDELGAALVALIEGPDRDDASLIAGVASSLPPATELLGYTLDNTSDVGRATLDFNRAFESGGGTSAIISRLAQVVYTATQFPDVDEVVIAIEGNPVEVFSSEGVVLDGPQTRDDYRDWQPLILVESPLPGSAVESPIDIHGVANTFEANLQYRIETQDGRLLADGFTTATCGTGCWGEYTIDVDYALADTAPGFVVVFESSAQDGRPINVVRIPVTLAAVEGATAGPVTEVYAEIPGGAPLNGAVVIESPLRLSGFSQVSAEITINGDPVATTDGSFQASIELIPGANEIVVGDGVTDTVYTVTYVPGGTVEFAYLTEVVADLVVADYAQWLTGDAANQAALEDGAIGEGETVPNDYYIRNQNPQLRTLPVAPEVAINLPTPAFGSVINVTVTVGEWLGQFHDDGTPWDIESGDTRPDLDEPHFGYFGAGDRGFGYWLTLDAAGNIVQITGQYRP